MDAGIWLRDDLWAKVCDDAKCACRRVLLVAGDRAAIEAVLGSAPSAHDTWEGRPGDGISVFRADLDGRLLKPLHGDAPAPSLLGDDLDELHETWAEVQRRPPRLTPAPVRALDVAQWQPGTLVPWRTVFRYDRSDHYVIDGVRVEVADLYCLTPGCDCTEAILHAHEIGTQREIAAIEVNYGEERGPGTSEDADDELWRRFVARHPDWPRRMRTRHAAMKPWGQELADTRTALPPPRTKVGRNDDCPCGSGKKYKKCCGR